MRATVELDEAATKAVEQLCREEGLGVSQAVNALIRRGLLPRPEPEPLRRSAPSLWGFASTSPTSRRPWRTSRASRRAECASTPPSCCTPSTATAGSTRDPPAFREPLDPAEAWLSVDDWLDAPVTWIPEPGRAHREILGRLVRDLDLRANLVSDAALAALCLEHGLTIVSADSDFARFPEVSWLNPLHPG